MDMDIVTRADMQDLATRPGTVLVGRPVDGGPSWTVRITAPADIRPDECPIYSTSWGSPDADGLSDQVRTYLTHQVVVGWLARGFDLDQAAEDATSLTEVAMARWVRGDDAIGDELHDDPAAWAKYVT